MNTELEPKGKNCSFDKWQPDFEKRCLYLNASVAKWPRMKASQKLPKQTIQRRALNCNESFHLPLN